MVHQPPATEPAGASGALDALADELAPVREAGPNALDVEPLLSQLPILRELPVVRRRARTETTLARAEAIVSVVWEAAGRLDSPGEEQLAQLLFGTHYRTKGLPPAKAREAAQEASGVEMRQFRARREARLLRLVAEEILELDREDDLLTWGHAMEVGADVPQTVALYWLTLFRDHYFRMETSAYALQTDLATAVDQRRNRLPTWRQYLNLAVYWNVEFSYLRQRFFRQHGPMWFTIAEEAGVQLNDSAQRIEYHDPYPDEYMSKLRLIYGRLETPESDLFYTALDAAGQTSFVLDKAQSWLTLCSCEPDDPQPRCEIHLVLKHCDLFGQTVENDFERIQQWYRTERHAADPNIRDLIQNFRRPGTERSYLRPQQRS